MSRYIEAFDRRLRRLVIRTPVHCKSLYCKSRAKTLAPNHSSAHRPATRHICLKLHDNRGDPRPLYKSSANRDARSPVTTVAFAAEHSFP
jgi:hypothetical protein